MKINVATYAPLTLKDILEFLIEHFWFLKKNTSSPESTSQKEGFLEKLQKQNNGTLTDDFISTLSTLGIIISKNNDGEVTIELTTYNSFSLSNSSVVSKSKERESQRNQKYTEQLNLFTHEISKFAKLKKAKNDQAITAKEASDTADRNRILIAHANVVMERFFKIYSMLSYEITIEATEKQPHTQCVKISINPSVNGTEAVKSFQIPLTDATGEADLAKISYNPQLLKTYREQINLAFNSTFTNTNKSAELDLKAAAKPVLDAKTNEKLPANKPVLDATALLAVIKTAAANYKAFSQVNRPSFVFLYRTHGSKGLGRVQELDASILHLMRIMLTSSTA